MVIKIYLSLVGDVWKEGYISKNGISINSDVNGACNILKKHSNKDVEISHKILSNVRKINISNGSKKIKSTLSVLLDKKEINLA